MTKVILWMLFVRCLSMWLEKEKRKMFPVLLAEKIDFRSELRTRVNIRPRCES